MGVRGGDGGLAMGWRWVVCGQGMERVLAYREQ
jgi:hypothetical protein